MYRLEQQSDMDFTPCHFRNQQKQEGLYDFLIDDKQTLLQHPPVLLADHRLTLESIQKLDYLEKFFACSYFLKNEQKKRIEEMVGDEVLFYPCKVNLRGELLEFYLAKIFRKLPIIDMENCPFRTLSNGKKIPTYPYRFTSQEVEFTLARDCFYPSIFVVSSKLHKEMHDLSLDLISLI